jgi:hypothetical protein
MSLLQVLKSKIETGQIWPVVFLNREMISLKLNKQKGAEQ